MTLLTTLLLVLITSPTLTVGIETIGNSNIEHNLDGSSDQDAHWNQELFHRHEQFTFRVLLEEHNDTCVNACEKISIRNFQAEFRTDEITSSKVDEVDAQDRVSFSRITGFLDNNKNIFGRLMNGLFNFFQPK